MGKRIVDELGHLLEDHLGYGKLWTVEDVAKYLQVSTKTVRRMEARGRFRRCPHLGSLVRFQARDVLRLASANGRED